LFVCRARDRRVLIRVRVIRIGFNADGAGGGGAGGAESDACAARKVRPSLAAPASSIVEMVTRRRVLSFSPRFRRRSCRVLASDRLITIRVPTPSLRSEPNGPKPVTVFRRRRSRRAGRRRSRVLNPHGELHNCAARPYGGESPLIILTPTARDCRYMSGRDGSFVPSWMANATLPTAGPQMRLGRPERKGNRSAQGPRLPAS